MNTNPGVVPKPSILIVDDDPDIGIAITDLLSGEGYGVDVVETGGGALTRLQEGHPYSAVLLDIGLPDMDGFAVLKNLQPTNPNLPVIILTAFLEQEKTIGSLERGAFAYLTKPYNRDELKATIRRAVGVQNLTVRVDRAERALDISEDRFQSVVKLAPDAIILADNSGNIISWNKTAVSLFGYTEKEILGQPLTMIMPDHYRDAHEAGLRRYIETGEARILGKTIEVDGLKKDGSAFPIEISLAANQNGGEKFFCGIIRDVTERKKAEQALKESEYRFQLTVDHINDGVFYLDLSGMIIWANQQAAVLLDRPFNKVIGHSFMECLSPEAAALAESRLATVRAGGMVPQMVEFKVIRPGGIEKWIEANVSDVVGDKMRIGRLLVGRDITEGKLADLALVERNRLLELDVEIGNITNQSQVIQVLLQNCTEAMVRHLDAAFVRIWCLDQEEQVLKLHASAGMYTHLDGPHSRVPVGQYKIGLIAATGKPILTNTVIGDPRVPEQEWARREGMVAFAGFPLLSKQEVLGVMGLFSRHALTEFTLKSLGIVADRITVAIERWVATDTQNKLTAFNEQILASAGEGIYGLDLEGKTTFVNLAAVQMVGYEVEELIGKSQHAILHHSRPDGSPYPKEECPIYAALRDGTVYHVDTEVFWRKDGTSFPVEYTSTPIRDDKGELEGAVVTFRDITERRRLEESVRESENRFRQVVELIKEVFWLTDPEKRQMLYVSPGYESIWGRSCESLYAAPQAWMEAIHPDDRDRIFEAAVSKQAAGEYDEEYRIIRPDGSVRWIRDRAFPLKNQQGKVYRIAGFAEDITDQKRQE